MGKGIFTISLDFELFWGVRDHRTVQNYGSNIRNVHNVVPGLLELFKKYKVHCTWATVGFLFCNDKEELLRYIPAIKPEYQKKEYDPYSYLQESSLDPVFHFAPALIDLIRKTPGQELSTHTFSHFYTLEKSTTTEQFRYDLQAAKKVSAAKGFELLSIVFPRNQYSEEHLRVCKEEGIKVYRGNELSVAYKPLSREDENIFRRAIRFIDAYINVTGQHCHALPKADEIINVPASRFLRPYDPRFKMLDELKLRRIKNGMRHAAENGQVYHLWWHPHNFGKHTEENFRFLERILKYYSQLNEQGKIESQNLIEIYSHSR